MHIAEQQSALTVYLFAPQSILDTGPVAQHLVGWHSKTPLAGAEVVAGACAGLPAALQIASLKTPNGFVDGFRRRPHHVVVGAAGLSRPAHVQRVVALG
jgi:hypothetical protein